MKMKQMIFVAAALKAHCLRFPDVLFVLHELQTVHLDMPEVTVVWVEGQGQVARGP